MHFNLKNNNHLFLFISSSKTDLLLYSNYLKSFTNFEKVEECLSSSTFNAVIILCQGTADYIEHISTKRQLAMLLSECNINIYDKNDIHQTIEQVSALIQQSPVLVLHFTTPENSINLLYDHLHI